MRKRQATLVVAHHAEALLESVIVVVKEEFVFQAVSHPREVPNTGVEAEKLIVRVVAFFIRCVALFKQ